MSDRTFMGIPVEGDYNTGPTWKEQWPLEKLAPFIQDLIDDDHIVEFGWTQYTPHFNDGDPCEFDVNALWVGTVNEVDGEDKYGNGFDEWSLSVEDGNHLGEYPYLGYDRDKREPIVGPYQGPDEARYNRCHALNTMI